MACSKECSSISKWISSLFSPHTTTFLKILKKELLET